MTTYTFIHFCLSWLLSALVLLGVLMATDNLWFAFILAALTSAACGVHYARTAKE